MDSAAAQAPKTCLPWWRFLLRLLWPFLVWLGLLFATAAVTSRPDEDAGFLFFLLLLWLFCVASWPVCCIWAAVQTFRRLRPPWAAPVGLLLLVVLLPLPLLDQMVCQRQFNQVCRSLKTEITDLPDARDRFHDAEEDRTTTTRPCLLPWLRITVERERLLDHATGETFASCQWAWYRGSWLARILEGRGAASDNICGYCQSRNDDLEEQLRRLGMPEYAGPLPQHPTQWFLRMCRPGN